MMYSYRQFEALCQKPRWREVGSPLARHFARPVGMWLTYWLVRLPISADMITWSAIVVGSSSALSFGFGGRLPFAVGVTLLLSWYLLDHVDGQIARFRRAESITGIYLDFVMHHFVHLIVPLGWGYGLARALGHMEWVLAGMALGVGWTMLGVANDSVYKAYYCHMNRTREAIRIPDSPDASDAPRLIGLRRLLVSCCEIPSVLVVLFLFACVEIMVPALVNINKWYLLCLAAFVPFIALYRIVRQVCGKMPDLDYAKHVYSVKQPDAVRMIHSSES